MKLSVSTKLAHKRTTATTTMIVIGVHFKTITCVGKEIERLGELKIGIYRVVAMSKMLSN
jgi:hypothetical protein